MENAEKKFWTQKDFDYSKVKIGDYVEQAVVDDAMDCLPPASMRSDCSQLGEPYSTRFDPESGNWRSTYATFKRVSGAFPNGIWQYCGHCFRVSSSRTSGGTRTSNAARTSKCVKFHDPGLPIGNQHFRLFKITLKMLKGGF